jgi:hypothetical protein
LTGASLPAAVAGLRGCTVRRFVVDDSLTLVLQAADREATLRIDTEGSLERGAERHAFSPDADPAGLAPVLSLLGAQVREVVLGEDGRLELGFGDGARLSALPHDHQVSWAVQASGGASAACIAEGKVVWE